MILKLIDKWLLGSLIRSDFHLTEKDKEYLRRYKDDVKLQEILEKISTSVVISAVSTRTVEGLVRKDEWRRCIGKIKGLMNEKVNKPKTNRITGLPFKNK